MNGRIWRKGVMGILAAVLLMSAGYAVKTALDFQQEAEIYQSAVDTFVTIVEEEVPLAQLPTTDSTATPTFDAVATQPLATDLPEEVPPVTNPLEPGISVDFSTLIPLNTDILAWLHIPNTTISYPVLQGEDNQRYLDTTYNGGYSVVGSIFMDYRVSGDFTGQNTIIYGHNVSSGIMFGSLDAYKDISYAQEHPYFFLLTDQGYLRYEVCYAMTTTATSFVYDFVFTQEQSYLNHLSNLAQQSLYDLGVDITQEDKIVTLSTCTGVTQEQRFVVIGKLDTPTPIA